MLSEVHSEDTNPLTIISLEIYPYHMTIEINIIFYKHISARWQPGAYGIT